MCRDYSTCGSCGEDTPCTILCYCDEDGKNNGWCPHRDCDSFERCPACDSDICESCFNDEERQCIQCKKVYCWNCVSMPVLHECLAQIKFQIEE